MTSKGTGPGLEEATKPANGGAESTRVGEQRIISSPGDVAGLVMMQIDAVNAKKDELTIALKGLTDTAKQLVRAYSEHAQAIAKLKYRLKELEEGSEKQARDQG